MKPKVILTMLAVLTPLLYFAAGRFGGPGYPADLRDAVADSSAAEQLGADKYVSNPDPIRIGLSAHYGANITSTTTHKGVIPDASRSFGGEKSAEDIAIREGVYVRVYMAAVQIDWANRISKENDHTCTVGRATSLFKESIAEFKNTASNPPTKEAYETVLYVNEKILLVLEESARRLGYNSTDQKGFEKLFKDPYTRIMSAVAYMNTLSQARFDAANIASGFVNGTSLKDSAFAEKGFFSGGPCEVVNFSECRTTVATEKAGLHYVTYNMFKVSALAHSKLSQAGVEPAYGSTSAAPYAKAYAAALKEFAGNPMIIGVKPPDRAAFEALLFVNVQLRHVYETVALRPELYYYSAKPLDAIFCAVRDAKTLEEAKSKAKKIADKFVISMTGKPPRD